MLQNKILYANYLQLKNFYIFVFSFLLFFININCNEQDYYISECQEDNIDLLNDEHCFNNILTFEHKNY